MDSDPPFEETYKTLFENSIEESKINRANQILITCEECELPLIDIGRLSMGELEREECKKEIARASQEWGFFQVINHGVSSEILEDMRSKQMQVFKQPFRLKTNHQYLNLSAGCYRWGTPTATCLSQLSWSEAFHIPLMDISSSGGLPTTLRYLLPEKYIPTQFASFVKFCEIWYEDAIHCISYSYYYDFFLMIFFFHKK